LFIEELQCSVTGSISALTSAAPHLSCLCNFAAFICSCIACVHGGLLIGPALLIMRINKLINNIIISIIITIVVPNVADQ
jgi:hypothetical protein